MSPEPRARTFLIFGLLLLHVGWIGYHLTMVAGQKINPWKLGGYGMYTVPHLDPWTHAYLFDGTKRQWVELNRADGLFGTFKFNRANALHVFRCRPFSSESLVSFFDENPHLRNRPLTLAVSEVQFDRNDASHKRNLIKSAQIVWPSQTAFAYKGESCDQPFEGVANYLPPSASS